MADASTLGSRLSAARAITTTQTSGAQTAATPPKAATGNSSSTSTESPASSTDAETSDGVTSALSALSTDTTSNSDDSASESSSDGDSAQTPEALKKGFTRLSKRERKLKKDRREWTEATRAKEAEFAKARQELIAENNRIGNLQRHAEQRFGWAARGEQAWDAQDKVAFAKAIERMGKGASLASITQWLAGATDQPRAAEKAQPSEEEQAWRREKAEHDRKLAAEREKAEGAKKETSSAEKREQARGRLASAFGKHPFLANPDDPKKPDPDALDEALGKVAEAMKHRKPGETGHQVAKRVLDDLQAREVRRAKRLGLEVKTPAAKPAATKGEAKQGERLPEPPPTNKNAKPASLDDTRAARVAAAKRLGEMQRRGII